jgi:hypothetical protein
MAGRREKKREENMRVISSALTETIPSLVKPFSGISFSF